MITQFVIFFTQIQAHQEIPEFGSYVVLLFSALSHTLFLLSAFFHTDADIMKVLWLSVGYHHLCVFGGFGVCGETSPSFVVNVHGFWGLQFSCSVFMW